MILGGAEIIARNIVRNLRDTALQQQPCGVDLTLRQISQWTSAATLDFDNTRRRAAQTFVLPFNNTEMNDGRNCGSNECREKITLPPGAYLVDFNEAVSMPRNCMGTILARSSLWRSGVLVSAGVVDAGYRGALGALMEVKNIHGVELFKGARLAQLVVEEMAGEVEGYSGVYQGSTGSVGLDGAGATRPKATT